MCGWQVKLCDPLVTHGSYMSALAVVLPIIRRYANNLITLTLTPPQKAIILIQTIIQHVFMILEHVYSLCSHGKF